VIRQSFTLVRSHVGSVGSKRRIRLVGCKAMILFARRLVSVELRPRPNRELQKSEIYFTNHTLTGKPEGCSFWKSDAGGRPEDRSVSNAFVRTVGTIFYFTNRTLAGNKSLSALTPEAAKRWQSPNAVSSPNFFHQSHFDWEQESLRSRQRKPPTAANRPLHLRRQTFFTNHTLTGSRILRLLSCTMVGLTADKSPSLRHVLTLKKFRTTKCPL
jgi:hypothetical protein